MARSRTWRAYTTVTAAAVLAVGGVTAGQSALADGQESAPAAAQPAGPYRIALIGDMPYGELGSQQAPNVIREINADQQIRFTVFDGDTKNGKDRCDDAFYPANKAGFFDAFRQPIVYEVGDNEWTDCDRPSAGSYNPSGRLALIRRTYFDTPRSLGQTTFRVTRQTGYPENQRWRSGGVTYIALNVPGSDNNFPVFENGQQVDGNARESHARNAANLRWLQHGFNAAKAHGSEGVLVLLQADMDWENLFQYLPDYGPTDGYVDTKETLRRLTLAYAGQVLLVNGDSHTYKVDKPMRDNAGQLVENFTRLQTFGSDENHWVSASIDPRDPNVFELQPHIVAANVADHSGG